MYKKLITLLKARLKLWDQKGPRPSDAQQAQAEAHAYQER